MSAKDVATFVSSIETMNRAMAKTKTSVDSFSKSLHDYKSAFEAIDYPELGKKFILPPTPQTTYFPPTERLVHRTLLTDHLGRHGRFMLQLEATPKSLLDDPASVTSFNANYKGMDVCVKFEMPKFLRQWRDLDRDIEFFGFNLNWALHLSGPINTDPAHVEEVKTTAILTVKRVLASLSAELSEEFTLDKDASSNPKAQTINLYSRLMKEAERFNRSHANISQRLDSFDVDISFKPKENKVKAPSKPEPPALLAGQGMW